MPIDASIAMGIRPPQIEPPMNALARVMELRGLQQQQELGQMKMDEYRREAADKNALLQALSAPDADPYKALIQRGKIKEATDYLKGKADVGKTEAETRFRQLETVKRQVDLAGQAFGYVRANPTLENAMAVLDSLERQGIYQPDQVAQMRQMVQQNPQNVAGLADQAFRMALDAKEQIAKYQTNNIGGQTITQGIDPVTGKATLVSAVQNTQSPDNIATNARIAQDNALSRAQSERHFQANQNQPRGQFLETPDGYVLADPKSGGVRPVLGADGQPLKGKAANRQLTDAQAKANLFGSRMKESDRILTGLEGKYSPMAVNAKTGAEKIPLVGPVAGYAGNKLLSEQGQQAEQAQRDFINAVLRRESGAVISEPEFENAKKQYFPQPGDTQTVLAQKRRNRQLAISGMEAEVPGGFRATPSLTTTGQTGGATGDFGAAPAVGAVQDGYIFKGGNPADPKSWEKAK